jgi:hypothetical protein
LFAVARRPVFISSTSSEAAKMNTENHAKIDRFVDTPSPNAGRDLARMRWSKA